MTSEICGRELVSEGQALVGDPIDVVSGANVDRPVDFRIPGAVPLVWRRHHDSSLVKRRYPLGWGHTHEYDHRLRLDVDGLRYEAPSGRSALFPPLLADGDTAAADGFVIRRVKVSQFHVERYGQPALEFEFGSFDAPAVLRRVALFETGILLRYGARGRLEGFVDETGRTIRVESDDAGRIVALVLTEADGGEDRPLVRYEYDAAGNLVRGTDAYKSSFRMVYDASNRLIAKTDRRGYTFTFEYDDAGRCVRSAGQDGLHEVKLRYVEGATFVTKADGGEWTYVHDAQGRVKEVLDPYGGKNLFIADAGGRTSEEVDPEGNACQIVYDEKGRLIGKLDPVGQFRPGDRPATKRRREEIHAPTVKPPIENLAAVFLAHVPTTWGARHLRSNPVRWELGDLVAPRFARLPREDAAVFGKLPAFVASLVRVHPDPRPEPEAFTLERKPFPPGAYTHDLLGNMVRHTDPDGGTETWGYDAGGNVARHRDRDGSVWQYEYTSWDLLAREVSPAGRTTAYEQTRTERLQRVTDAGGSTNEYGYDLVERLASVRRGGLPVEEYSYAPKELRKRDAERRELLTAEIGASGLPAAISRRSGDKLAFAHDEEGRCVAASSVDCQVTFAYDELGNLVRDEQDSRAVTHVYDAFDLVETSVLERFRIAYERTPGRLVVEDPAGGRHEIRTLENGFLLKSLSNGTREVAQYQHEGLYLLKVSYRDDSRFWARQYHYSAEASLLRVIDNERGTSEFEYDADHWLTRRRGPGSEDASFRHDAAGNLLEQPGLADVAIDAGNRLMAANGEAFTYDGRGRLVERMAPAGATVYAYDSSDQLVRCAGPSRTVEARYDAFGRRVRKLQGERADVFIWDRERLAAEISPTGRLRLYVYANPKACVPLLFIDYDSTEADLRSGRRYFVFTDQVGAPIRIEDDAGAARWRAVVEPYGTARVEADTALQDFALRFPGHYFDFQTGLHYNRCRYYDPGLGRYIQPDPDDVAGGLNLYASPQSPLTDVDVDGRCPKKTPPLNPDEDDKDNAARMAARIRNELDQNPNAHGFTTHDNVTYAVMVVTMADGSQRTVVTCSGDRRSIHPELGGVVAADRFVSPTSNGPGDSGHHAEQRAMAWARENSTNPDPSQRVASINAISPTRPCCPGCQSAIGRRGDPNLNVVSTPAGVPKTR